MALLAQKKSFLCSQSPYVNHVIVGPQGAERKMRDEERKRSKRRTKPDANGEFCR